MPLSDAALFAAEHEEKSGFWNKAIEGVEGRYSRHNVAMAHVPTLVLRQPIGSDWRGSKADGT